MVVDSDEQDRPLVRAPALQADVSLNGAMEALICYKKWKTSEAEVE
jgi:hypothetical protein